MLRPGTGGGAGTSAVAVTKGARLPINDLSGISGLDESDAPCSHRSLISPPATSSSWPTVSGSSRRSAGVPSALPSRMCCQWMRERVGVPAASAVPGPAQIASVAEAGAAGSGAAGTRAAGMRSKIGIERANLADFRGDIELVAGSHPVPQDRFVWAQPARLFVTLGEPRPGPELPLSCNSLWPAGKSGILPGISTTWAVWPRSS